MQFIANFMLQKDEQNFILANRIKLLKEIGKTGSISKAAKNVPMSYKTAWEAVDLMNSLSERVLVEKTTGGRQGGGSILSDYARQLIVTYDKTEEISQKFMQAVNKEIDFSLQISPTNLLNLERIAMQISARNIFSGKITHLTESAVNVLVQIELRNGQRITSVITKSAVEHLQLTVGKTVKAIIKASSVMIATKEISVELSAQNSLSGRIERLTRGEVDTEVSLNLGENQILTAVITDIATQQLALREGQNVYGIIKSSDVMLGI